MKIRVFFSPFVMLFLVSILNVSGFGSYRLDNSFKPSIRSLTLTSPEINQVDRINDDLFLVRGRFNLSAEDRLDNCAFFNSNGELIGDCASNPFSELAGWDNLEVDSEGNVYAFNTISGLNGSRDILKLDSLGEPVKSFDYKPGFRIANLRIDSQDRVFVSRIVDKTPTLDKEELIRLSPDGSQDSSFIRFIGMTRFWVDGVKPVYWSRKNQRLFRLEEDGSFDTDFQIPSTSEVFDLDFGTNSSFWAATQTQATRYDNNGVPDPASTPVPLGLRFKRMIVDANNDGLILFDPPRTGKTDSIRRYFSNGSLDTSFQISFERGLRDFAFDSKGNFYVGYSSGRQTARIRKYSPSGIEDQIFNSNHMGFSTEVPALVERVAIDRDGRILIGGKFDSVGDENRFGVARLFADGNADTSFVFGGNNPQFVTQLSFISDIYPREDGRIFVSGSFDYLVNGFVKNGLVRLLEDGTIDSGFIPSRTIPLIGPSTGFLDGQLAQDLNENVYIGTSRSFGNGVSVPLKMSSAGEEDLSFTPAPPVVGLSTIAEDVEVLNNQQILVSGFITGGGPNSSFRVSYMDLLNPDGSSVESFFYEPQSDWRASRIIVQDQFGFVVLHRNLFESVSVLRRVKMNGQIDNDFYSGLGASGDVRSMIELPDGRIAVAGSFETFHGEPRKNFAVLNADGTLDPTRIDLFLNIESMAVDDQGRIYVVGISTTTLDPTNPAERNLLRLLPLTKEKKKAPFDFDGDGRTDISTFDPSTGTWEYRLSSNAIRKGSSFGTSGDIQVAGDYTGDGVTDIAVFRPTTGEWFVLRSDNGGFYSFNFGRQGDIPVTGFVSGQIERPTIFRPETGEWFVSDSNGNVTITRFGTAGDIPIAQDYDGDGESEISVFRPSTGVWWVLGNNGFFASKFGQEGDFPVPGDFTGDGRADITVWRPSEGNWYSYDLDLNEVRVAKFGTLGDVPLNGDFDGDGQSDYAVYRESERNWYILGSNTGFQAHHFVSGNGQPIPAR